ncbi:transporter [Mucilaginibacter sp. BJC16-A38]|uniref:transporter n=1 Tax=Mucilaginibacter phenanthrenivorans TaxID=1234842 RepID=UPI002157A0D9|nr:transporter [Mucilaginibacter phenanthrenivorans]MCR8556648.1 transporter [Mucilaginibacter phenanthrenivorans]
MIKFLHLFFTRYCLATCCIFAFWQTAQAQTDADALMIPKNYFCTGVVYTHSDWKNYWEGTFKRSNANIGTLSSNAFTVVGNYGVTNKLDFLFMAPYIKTNASQGTLKGQSGVQDLTVGLKYLAFNTEIGKGLFSIHAIAEGSIPLSNYEPDFLPVSIGLHTKNLSIRGLANYQVGRFFVAGAGQYVFRSNITLDRNSYYTDHLIYSNQVDMPNVSNVLISAGYRSLKLNVEGIVSQTTTQGGFDIRKNDMPFPSNRMNMTTVGGLAKYSFEDITGVEVTVGGNYVVRGRNVGQSTNLFASVYYILDFSKKTK